MATVQKARPVAPEQRIVLHNIRWETYERLLADHESASAPRFTYDRGALEIMSPMREHEQINRAIASLVEIVAEELGIDFNNLGSTTFKRQDLERGFEPDSCFYFENEPAIRGNRNIDLLTDPPPDLVIEIDITHSSQDKLALFSALGIKEVWRFDGRDLSIFCLEANGYVLREQSATLPGVSAADVTRFASSVGSASRIAWMRQVRAWARRLSRQ